MARLCARPGCSAPAAATFNFDGLNRIAWLNPLADAAAYSAGDLCQHHAEHFRPPRNWELRDCRPAASPQRPGATAPSRHYAPSAAPHLEPVSVAAPPPIREDRPAASRRPLVPRERPAPAPVTAPATTPLLARAFRGVGGD